MLRTLFSRVLATFRRRRLETELDDEVRQHLELLAQRFIAQGMAPAEAVYAARRQFGGVTQMKEDLRERRALPPVDVLWQDFRHGFRQLRRARWFTVSAALTLALGIGASTAVFAVLDAVVLRPLPFAAPERLMAFRSVDRRSQQRSGLSYPAFFDFRAQNRVFEHMASYRDVHFTLSEKLPPMQIGGQIVGWDLFQTLGVQPELGRGFRPEEENAGTHVAVLSHSLWQRRFGGDPRILSRHIRMNGALYQVVGVAPPRFRYPVEDSEVELWTTLAIEKGVAGAGYTPLTEQRGARVVDVIARLQPGVTAGQARAQMDQVAAALALQYPDEHKNIPTTSVMPELQRLTGPTGRPLWILLGAVGLVLLTACANVAGLLLARSTERAREWALRTALGASRPMLVRQLLAESLLLSLLGSAGGILLAFAALRLLLPLAGDRIPIPRVFEAGIDVQVLAFSIVAALLTTVLFTLAPAAQVVRAHPTGALKEGAANIARGRHRMRSALVVAQITLGLVLLVGAETLIASFLYLVNRDPGFEPRHLLTFNIGQSDALSTTAEQIAFCDRLRERLRAVPEVREVASGMPLPLEGEQMTVAFDIEERPAAAPDRPHADISIVTPGFFHTMGIQLLEGRDFTEHDDTGAPRVLVVNRAFARKYFPGEDALGKRVEPGATNGPEGMQMREIVGVVADAKQEAWSADPDPIYYFPYKQLSWDMGAVVVRTAGPPLELETAARAALTELDREAPLCRVRTGDQIAYTAVALPRFLSTLMGAFAAIALLLTVGGLYGVLAYVVARRRREIGVRIALGAGRKSVLGLVLQQAMRLVAAGLALGLVAAGFAQRLLSSAAIGTRPDDPVFLYVAACVMVIASFLAAYIPALRAASVNPIEALRSE